MEISAIPHRDGTEFPILDTDLILIKNAAGTANWILAPTLKVYNPGGGTGGGVQSVNGYPGPNVVLTKSDLSLGNVDNTSDANKPISTATQTALSGKAATVHTHTPAQITTDANNRFVTDAEKTTWNNKQSALGFTAENSANRGVANGYTPLGADIKVPSAYLPSYVDDVLEFANLASFPATGESGKIYIALDTNLTYRWGGTVYVSIGTGGGVQSVNGETGIVTLTKGHIGLGSVDNTSDANKPISTATQTALNSKEPTLPTGTTAQYFRGDKTLQTLNKAAVGLSNVDNTADASKPISTATQTALDGKVDKEAGKVLSTNDYSTTEKNKLAALEPTTPAYIKTQYESNADTNAFTDAEKTKLGTLQNYNDTAIQTSITNLTNNKANIADLADVAFSGEYVDVLNKPKYEVQPVLPSDLSTYPTGSIILIPQP